jgi:hypothetical protein
MNRSLALRFGIVLAIAAPSFFVEGCSKSTSSSGNADLGVSSILFIKRQHTTVSGDTVDINVASGNSQVIDYQRYVPGGSLNILTPARPDGNVINLTSAFPTADFNGADVSFDASQAVFSMKKKDDDHYHIYTVALTPGADGKYEIHQKTAGDYDDINPVFAAGNRIVFVTNEMYTAMGTRCDEYEHGREVTQLAIISVDGGDADRRLFPQNLSHSVAPFLRADGKIAYSRWEHLGPTNDVKIFAANPDGTQMLAIAGQHNKPCNSLFSIREMGQPNVMLGVCTARDRTIHAGTLVQIDSRNQNDPTCLDPHADQTGHACVDEEHAQFTILSPNVPAGSDPSPAGRYREPSPLPDGRILTSWADGPVNDLSEQSATPPNFGIYVFDVKTQKNQLVYDDRNTWDLNALAIAPHAEPPSIGDLQHVQDATQPAHIGSVNVGNTSLDETVTGAEFNGTPLADALKSGAVGVRVIEGFSSEAAKGVTMFGLTMHEGASVLGETTVYPDGSWLADIPPYIPVHLQPIDKFGLSIRSQGLWIQGSPNENRRCPGCHESRIKPGLPTDGQRGTAAEQHGPENLNLALDARVTTLDITSAAQIGEYGWDTRVQKTLTDKCASCHNSSTTSYYQIIRTDPVTGKQTTYNIPYLDLSDTPVTAYYDRQVKTWPASYVSLFYPSAMEMGMNTTVTGKVPPKWMVPANARGSAAIEKLNVRASDGSTAWPTGTHPMHPEDKGVTLTDGERKMLILTADLGGQYYARQNTDFKAFTAGDPTNPTTAK